MVLLLALLVGGIGASSTTTEPTLPLQLILPEIETVGAEAPERDALWRVDWIEVCLLESPEDRFHWPAFAVRPEADRLQDTAGESWEQSYTSRIDLGLRRLQQVEMKAGFFPTASRVILGL